MKSLITFVLGALLTTSCLATEHVFVISSLRNSYATNTLDSTMVSAKEVVTLAQKKCKDEDNRVVKSIYDININIESEFKIKNPEFIEAADNPMTMLTAKVRCIKKDQ